MITQIVLKNSLIMMFVRYPETNRHTQSLILLLMFMLWNKHHYNTLPLNSYKYFLLKIVKSTVINLTVKNALKDTIFTIIYAFKVM